MWDRGCAGAAGRSDLSESPRRTYWGFALVAFAFVALVGAELALIITIPGGNYGGADGKAAQAEILATLEFARAFDISNLNPLQGMGSQMMPMNVWVNPAYWPFALFDKELATEISGVVALVCYAVACYVMARCFDLPRLPSVVAAQLSVMLFGPAVLALSFSVVFCSIPGLAVVYAPHMLAFGLLARLSPKRPQVFLIGGGLLVLLFYSLYCDPLWTMVSGLAWVVPFGVVTFSSAPPRYDPGSMRCARRLRGRTASERRARVRVLIVAIYSPRSISGPTAAPAASCVRIGYFPVQIRKILLLGLCAWLGAWNLAAARSGTNSRPYGGSERGFIICLYRSLFVFGRQLVAAAAPLHRACSLRTVLDGGNRRLLGRAGGAGCARSAGGCMQANRWRPRLPSLSPRQAAAAAPITAVLAASIVPAIPIIKALRYPKEMSKYWYEPWPNEPELREYLGNNISLRIDPRFRGSVFFYTFQYDEFLTLNNLWVDAVPTINEYSQLITPQAIYFIRQLFKRNRLN